MRIDVWTVVLRLLDVCCGCGVVSKKLMAAGSIRFAAAGNRVRSYRGWTEKLADVALL
jgi:hypothetical protein